MSTSTLMTAAAIGIAGCVVVVPLSYLQVAAGLADVALVAATLGAWMLPCLFPLVFVRRPGATVVACLTIGVVSAVTTPFGPAAIGALLLEGILLEAPFLATRYRRWDWWLFAVSAVVFGAFMGYFTTTAVGVQGASAGLVAATMAVAVASCLAFLAVCLWLARALRRTGLGARVGGPGQA
jgi:energy-coupling factor transport system substrate-specific component